MASLSKCVDLATRFTEEDVDELVQEMVLVREDMDVDDNVAALEAATRIVERSQTVRDAITDKTGPIVNKGVQIKEVADGFEAFLDGEKVGRLKDTLARGQAALLDEPATIDIVKVDDKARGKGVGSALYKAFFDKHEGRVAPSGKTTADAWRVWKRNYPDKVDEFVAQEQARIAEGADPRIVAGNITDAEVKSRVLGTRRSAARDQTETPEFKKWFGDSKVVDAEGKPLVVYHGTGESFDEFDPDAQAAGNPAVDNGLQFFTSSAREASGYARMSGPVGANVLPVYLKIENPLRVDVEGSAAEHWDASGGDVRDQMDAGGHDGIVLQGTDAAGTMFITSSPEQIKSAIGNDGSFDPSNPDIRRSTRRSQDDLFSREFATKRSSVPTNRLISSNGDTAKGGNTDSAGQQITATKQGLENFWDWFGNSIAVDDRDRPLVLYHSTNADTSTLRPGEASTNNYGFLGNVDVTRAGIFMTPSADFSQEYLREGSGQNVMPLYAKTENPLDLRSGLSQQDEAALEAAGVNIRYVLNIQNHWELFDNADDGSNDFVDGLKRAGYDSAIFREGSPSGDTAGGVTYVVFSPEQVKSATGNRGTFDPSNPDIRRSPPRWQMPEPTRLDDFIRKMQDKQIDTKRVVASIKQAISGINEAFNPYLQEELYHGRAAKATKDFLDLEMRPLLQDMQARGLTIEETEKYLHNLHAEERNAQIAKVNPAMPDGGSGIDTADAKAYLAGLSASKRAALNAIAKRVEALNRKTQKMLVDSGLEKQSTIDAWNAAYKHYVPLQREEFADDALGGTGQGFSVRGAASKRAMGSTKEVSNILGNLSLARERTITRAEKNRVSTALYGLAIQAPGTDFWYAFAPERVKITPKLEAELVAMGMNPIDVQSILAEPAQQYIDPRTGMVTTRVNPLLRSAPNVVALRVNGEDRFVLFNDRNERAQRMSAALKNLDADQMGEVLGLAAKVSRWFASVNTQYNPVFGIVNGIRDVQSALFNLSTTPIAGQQAAVTANAMSAVRGIYSDIRAHRKGNVPQSKWAQLYEEFQREGGQTGFRDMFKSSNERAEAIEDEFKKLTEGKAKMVGRAVFGWLSDYNETIENATRLAAYKVALDQGLTKQEAASIAKNLTVNFNRKGQAALQAGALYAFFNASVQGTARLAETLRGPAGRKIVLGGLLLGVLQALALSAAGFGAEEPPEFVKERSLVVPIGDGKYLSMPMPLGFHVLPSISRIATEWALNGFREPAKRLVDLLSLFADTFNPIGNAGISMQTVAPTALDPLAALLENKDYTGKPIAREDMNPLKPTPGYLRAKDTASELSKQLSYYLNLASGGTKYQPGAVSPTPDQIDYLIGQVTGGVGREALKAEQTVTSARTGEELPPNKVPLLGRFYGDTTGQASHAAKFYSGLKKVNAAVAEVDGRRENKELEGLQEYRLEHPELRLEHAAKKASKELTELKAKKRELLEKDAPPERIRLVEERITLVMKRFNERMDRLEDQQP